MHKKKMLRMTLATAAAMIFSGVIVTPVVADTAAVPCYGGNACKGQSNCRSIKNACSGENSCKGRGLAMLSSEDCETVGGSPNPPAP